MRQFSGFYRAHYASTTCRTWRMKTELGNTLPPTHSPVHQDKVPISPPGSNITSHISTGVKTKQKTQHYHHSQLCLLPASVTKQKPPFTRTRSPSHPRLKHHPAISTVVKNKNTHKHSTATTHNQAASISNKTETPIHQDKVSISPPGSNITQPYPQ